jgi:hypothetical protein
MIILFEVTYITANGYLGVTFIVPLFVVVASLNNIFASNNEYYLVRFSRVKFIEKINLGINTYLSK